MSYPTRSHIEDLPVEPLVNIFLFIAPAPVTFEDWTRDGPNFREFDDDRGFIFPGSLGAVSKTWRDIIVSTPSLWTSLRWKEGKHDPMLIALHIMRSKTLPLYLMLSFFEKRPNRRSLVAPSVNSIILPNMSRIVVLHLSEPPQAWLSQFDKLTSTSAMTISWKSEYSGPEDEVLLNKCRSLRRLILSRGEDPMHRRVFYKLPRSLEELHLIRIPLDTVVKLLLTNPNLVKFTAEYVDSPHHPINDEISRWWFSEPSTFENLEELMLNRSNDDWYHRLLSQLSTPRLRRLCLTDPREIRYIQTPPAEGENQFFRRLPETLTTLELRSTQDFSPPDSPLFDHLYLENLILRDVDPKYIMKIFKGLTPTQGNHKCLPRLKNLSLLNLYFLNDDQELLPGHLEPMVSMLEQRLAKGDAFRVTFDCRVDWTPTIQRKLRNLRAMGIQLEIIEGSDAANWLD